MTSALKKIPANAIVLFIAIALMVMATYVYVSSRSGDMLLYTWLGIDYDNAFFEKIRASSWSLAPWVKYNLPDGLWLLSFLLFMEAIWMNDKRMKVMFCVPVVAFAFIIESMQFFGIFPGTGDVIDLTFYFVAVLVFTGILTLNNRYYEKVN